MSDTWAVAFAGPGKIEAALAADLLDDWLPQTDDLKIFIPNKIGRSAIGLKVVRSWMESVEQEYEEIGTSLVEALVDAKAENTFLVLLWGEEGDKASEELLLAAHEAKIPVKDLTKLLHDLIVEFPEPEPVVEAPKTRGRSRSVSNPPPKEEIKEQAAEVLDNLAEDRKKAEQLELPASMTEPTTIHFDQDEAQATDEVAQSALAQKICDSLVEDLGSAIRALVRDEVEKALEPGPRGRPRKDGLPPGSGPSQYVPKDDEIECTVVFDEDTDEYRLANRGRPKKGETRIKMTRAEAKAKGVEFPVEEDELPF